MTVHPTLHLSVVKSRVVKSPNRMVRFEANLDSPVTAGAAVDHNGSTNGERRFKVEALDVPQAAAGTAASA